jgi:hypothetical protein
MSIIKEANKVVKNYSMGQLVDSVREVQRQRGRIKRFQAMPLQSKGVVKRANSWARWIDPTKIAPFSYRAGEIVSNYRKDHE